MILLQADREAFRFIETYLATSGGVAPTYREIMVGVGSKSLGHVAQIVEKLERSRYLRRLPRRARAMEILKPTNPPSLKPDVTLPRDIGAAPASVRSAVLVGVRLK